MFCCVFVLFLWHFAALYWTGIIGTNLQGWKMRDQTVMESQTLTCYGTHNIIYLIFRPPGTVV